MVLKVARFLKGQVGMVLTGALKKKTFFKNSIFQSKIEFLINVFFNMMKTPCAKSHTPSDPKGVEVIYYIIYRLSPGKMEHAVRSQRGRGNILYNIRALTRRSTITTTTTTTEEVSALLYSAHMHWRLHTWTLLIC